MSRREFEDCQVWEAQADESRDTQIRSKKGRSVGRGEETSEPSFLGTLFPVLG